MIKLTSLDFYVAALTPPVSPAVIPTYGTPERVSGTSKVAVTYNKSTNKVYESGRAVYNKTHIADAMVSIESYTMALAKIKELAMNLTADTNTEFIEGDIADAPKNVAIGFAAQLSDGTYFCTWFFDAAAIVPDENYQTANESGPQIEPDTLEFSCVRRAGDKKLRRSKVCADATAMASFFAAVEPAAQQGA